MLTRSNKRRIRFALRTLLLLTAFVAIAMGCVGRVRYRSLRQRRAVLAIERLGGCPVYTVEATGVHYVTRPGSNPVSFQTDIWHRYWFGSDSVDSVSLVYLGGSASADDVRRMLPHVRALQRLRPAGAPSLVVTPHYNPFIDDGLWREIAAALPNCQIAINDLPTENTSLVDESPE